MLKRFLTSVFIVVLGIGILFVWWQKATSLVDSKDNAPVIFIVPKGQSVKEIASNLKKEDLIKSKIAFFLYARFSGVGQKFQAGNFRLNRTMNTIEIAHELTLGTTDIWITIIEGWRVEEIALALTKNLLIPETEFLKFAQEGYMFPDTYLIPKGTTAKQITDIILKNFQEKVTSETIEKGRLQGLSLDEIITLASIIEREVKEDNDRRIIAGILLKRLKNGWPLQIDATIQYILGYQPDEKSWWKRNLTVEDLAIDSPYNTYINIDLPPGPICNPSLSSIKAVISPMTTKYWFYLSDKQGNIHYATTEEEHNVNVQTYLR